MKDIKYQQEAEKKLVRAITRRLGESGSRLKIVFKAPTGSGKTVMMLETMRLLTDNLFVDPEAPTSEVAFIWIAPNKLHELSAHQEGNGEDQ